MIGLGSKTQLGIGIAIWLEDKFSKKAALLDQRLKAIQKGSFAAVDRAARDYRNASATIAAGAGIVTMALGAAARQGAKFEHSMRQTKIFAGRDLKTSLGDLTAQAEGLSREFGKLPNAVADAMLENVRAGISEDLDEITRKQIALAVSANEALEGQEGVAFGVLSILGQYNMKATDMVNVAGKQVKAIDAVTNGLQVAANKSMASVNDINQSMQYFGNTAKMVNMSLEQSLALVAQMSQGGIRGSGAGTALSNMVRQLTQNVGELAGPKKKWALAQLGISSEFAIARINAGQTFELLQDIAAASSKLDLNKQIEVGSQLFNIRGQRGQATVFTDFVKGQTKSRNQLGVNTMRDEIVAGIKNDVLGQQVKLMTNDLFTDMNRFGAQLEILKNQFVRAAGPVLRWIVQFGTGLFKVIGTLLDNPIGRVFASVVAIAAPLVTALFAFRAAAITAAFALRSLATSSVVTSQVQGRSWLGSLMGGVLGGGTGVFPGAMGGLVKNKAGNWYVPKGGSWTHPVTGQVFKAGKMVPQAAARTAMGAAGAASWGSKATGLLGSIGKFTGKLIPIATAAFGIWELVKLIAGDPDEGKSRPELMAYQQALFRGMVTSPDFTRTLSNYNREFNQNLVVNIDGVQVTNQRLSGILGDNMDSQFDQQLPAY